MSRNDRGRTHTTHRPMVMLLAVAMLMLTSCGKVYYGTWEALGVHKRDIMVSRVQDARDDQDQAKEQFASALKEFSAMFNFDGGDLEAKYKTLKAAYDASESKAQAVTSRIDSVERVSDALFGEWESELEQYTNADLRSASEKRLKETRKKYNQMIVAMRKAESRMQPVLSAFLDQVLFIKHNLNARALASIEGSVGDLETDVAELIAEMEASIKEADAFIESMGDGG